MEAECSAVDSDEFNRQSDGIMKRFDGHKRPSQNSGTSSLSTLAREIRNSCAQYPIRRSVEMAGICNEPQFASRRPLMQRRSQDRRDTFFSKRQNVPVEEMETTSSCELDEGEIWSTSGSTNHCTEVVSGSAPPHAIEGSRSQSAPSRKRPQLSRRGLEEYCKVLESRIKSQDYEIKLLRKQGISQGSCAVPTGNVAFDGLRMTLPRAFDPVGSSGSRCSVLSDPGHSGSRGSVLSDLGSSESPTSSGRARPRSFSGGTQRVRWTQECDKREIRHRLKSEQMVARTRKKIVEEPSTNLFADLQHSFESMLDEIDAVTNVRAGAAPCDEQAFELVVDTSELADTEVTERFPEASICQVCPATHETQSGRTSFVEELTGVFSDLLDDLGDTVNDLRFFTKPALACEPSEPSNVGGAAVMSETAESEAMPETPGTEEGSSGVDLVTLETFDYSSRSQNAGGKGRRSFARRSGIPISSPGRRRTSQDSERIEQPEECRANDSQGEGVGNVFSTRDHLNASPSAESVLSDHCATQQSASSSHMGVGIDLVTALPQKPDAVLDGMIINAAQTPAVVIEQATARCASPFESRTLESAASGKSSRATRASLRRTGIPLSAMHYSLAPSQEQ